MLCGAWLPGHEFYFASGSADRTVRLWDIRSSGERACLSTLNMHASRITEGRRMKDWALEKMRFGDGNYRNDRGMVKDEDLLYPTDVRRMGDVDRRRPPVSSSFQVTGASAISQVSGRKHLPDGYSSSISLCFSPDIFLHFFFTIFLVLSFFPTISSNFISLLSPSLSLFIVPFFLFSSPLFSSFTYVTPLNLLVISTTLMLVLSRPCVSREMGENTLI